MEYRCIGRNRSRPLTSIQALTRFHLHMRTCKKSRPPTAPSSGRRTVSHLAAGRAGCAADDSVVRAKGVECSPPPPHVLTAVVAHCSLVKEPLLRARDPSGRCRPVPAGEQHIVTRDLRLSTRFSLPKTGFCRKKPTGPARLPAVPDCRRNAHPTGHRDRRDRNPPCTGGRPTEPSTRLAPGRFSSTGRRNGRHSAGAGLP